MRRLPIRIVLLATAIAGLCLTFFYAGSPWIAMPFAVAFAAAFVAAFAGVPSRRKPLPAQETEVRQRFSCPVDGHDVNATFAKDSSGRWLRATQCSAFVFPEQVACGQECVRLRNRVAPGDAGAAGVTGW